MRSNSVGCPGGGTGDGSAFAGASTLELIATIASAASELAGREAPENGMEALQLAESLGKALDVLEAGLAVLVKRVDDAGSFGDLGYTGTAAWLRGRLGMRDHRAKERVRLARHLPRLKETSRRLTTGTLSLGYAQAIADAVNRLDADDTELAEHLLLGLADADHTPGQVASAGSQITDLINQHRGKEKEPEESKRGFTRSWMNKTRALDGGSWIKAYLTPEDTAAFDEIVMPLAKPKTQGDDRDLAQRTADAMMSVLTQGNKGAGVTVIIDLAAFTTATGDTGPYTTHPAHADGAGTGEPDTPLDPDDMCDDTDNPDRTESGGSDSAEPSGSDSEEQDDAEAGEDPEVGVPESDGFDRPDPFDRLVPFDESDLLDDLDLFGPPDPFDPFEKFDLFGPFDPFDAFSPTEPPGPRSRPPAEPEPPGQRSPTREQHREPLIGRRDGGDRRGTGMPSTRTASRKPGGTGPGTTASSGRPAARLLDGTPISPQRARQIALNAGINALILGRSQQPIYLGRKARFATPAQRKVLLALYETCCVQGCQIPAHTCEIHHLEGGWKMLTPTDINKLAPACGHHNRWIETHPDQVEETTDDQGRAVIRLLPPWERTARAARPKPTR